MDDNYSYSYSLHSMWKILGMWENFDEENFGKWNQSKGKILMNEQCVQLQLIIKRSS